MLFRPTILRRSLRLPVIHCGVLVVVLTTGRVTDLNCFAILPAVRTRVDRRRSSNVCTGSSTTITEVPVQLRRRKRPALGIALIDLHDA